MAESELAAQRSVRRLLVPEERRANPETTTRVSAVGALSVLSFLVVGVHRAFIARPLPFGAVRESPLRPFDQP